MGSLRAINVNLPGSHGLNTQEATVPAEAPTQSRFGAVVTNGVVDKSGKLTSRQDFVNQTSGLTGTVEALYVHRHTDGTETVLSATAGKLYSGVSSLTSRYDYSGTSTTNNYWQFASLSGKVFIAQAGMTLKCLNESTWADTALTGAPWSGSPNCVAAGYGRVWAADDAAGGNRHTLWWSNLLDGTTWNSGDAGSLSLINAWPQGQDSIVAVVLAYGRVIILGRNSILLYTLPADNNPASMTLTDTVSNLGCVARDSVIVTDNGVYFLSDNGVYRIDRLGQVTSLLALPQMSKLYTSDILTDIAAETAKKIRAGYYPKEGWYVLAFPTQNRTYCLHTRKMIPELDVPVTTVWNNTNMPFRAFAFDKDGNWYCAGTNGIHKYTGYTPDAASNAYTMTLTLQWNNFGDESKLKHFKGADLVVETASGQTGTFSWKEDYVAGTSRSVSFTCSAIEFAEDPGVGVVRIAGVGGSFSVVQPSVAFVINGDQVTLHQMRLFASPGKTTK